MAAGNVGLGLGKALEHKSLLIEGNTGPRIDHAEAHGHGGGRFAHLLAFHHHGALFSEFHGVAHQVEQGLDEPARVAHHPRHGAARAQGPRLENQTLLLSLRGQGLQRLAQGVAQVEGGLFQFELTGRDFSHIEHIVEHHQ